MVNLDVTSWHLTLIFDLQSYFRILDKKMVYDLYTTVHPILHDEDSYHM